MDETPKTKKKEIRHGNFSLDGSRYQTGDAAFTPASPRDLQHSRANTDSLYSLKNTRELKKIHFYVCKRALSPASYLLEDASHKTRPNIDAGGASLLIWSTN
jgi:hypothetical protein